ncbi:serine-protein kinase ATM isoform X1 [Melanotaenia boesemani]|uniref:serine-protein kinase ATM isoform X1 n=1 Tax=Melanotaenia boesemani TaxID=1250792 RepID=UPI001C0517F8|nr:serine-protein kinase ATM isoform X1 [Melanotaenia boesemani]XP_041851362.1 serine-protein kinase ATM isoform X1 [Melanotaenia boesemani]XP_041851363.1 serine-protein kinase ATM isoform X1 [Melanotaenia boesemani]XP_041851364.1 serine-protein kinase ATM isoform X1 [Melanotaenia boesemani]
MSLALHDLLVCCRGLENDKATERKKEAERFRRLLRSPEIMQELDRTSGSKAKGSKQLTWDAVFRSLQRYVQKETESMQSSRSNVTATTLATRRKKMAEMCSLIKYFIRYANKRGPRLKCSELLKHVMEVLQSSYCCSAYGEDYSSLLLKDILSVRKYWCDIFQQQWQSLLDLYCGLFNSTSKSINRVLLSRVIHTVVKGCCAQTDGFNDALFIFFSKALLNVRQEKHLTVLEHLVSALNIFLRSAAMNCRMRVCHLGEELLPSILNVWADMRPSAPLKEGIVEFVNLQICVHHPKGAKTQDSGAYAEDWTRWRSLLYNLYDALVREISQIGSRGKYVTGSRHVAVQDNIIELTADICHQLFNDDSDTQILEVTQASRSTQLGSPTHGAASKRRRVEMGWEVLRDHLQPQQSDFDVIPWLQIAAVLTSKYPSMMPGQELVPLLSVLHQLLAEHRRGERGLYVLRCLREVAGCQARYPQRAQVHRTELSRLWARIWALAVRGFGSPQTETLSLDLLASIVHGGLINIDREFWKLFSGSACKPSQSAALCLAQAMLKCSVPKSRMSNSGWDYMGFTEGCVSPNLKETLIAWLLMSDQSDEMEESSRPHPIICRDFPYNLIPNILVSLTLKDTRVALNFLLGIEGAESAFFQEQVDTKDNLEEIERLYQQFIFNALPSEIGGAGDESVQTGSANGQFAAVPGLRNKLEQSLLSMADNLLNCYSPDCPSTPPECLVRCFSQLTAVLAAYVSTGFLTEEEACRSQLVTKAKTLAQELSGFVAGVKVKMTEQGIMSTLRSVMKLCTQFTNRKNKDHSCSVASGLFIMTLPASLLSELAEICKLLFSNISKRGSVVDDDERVDDDWEMTTTHQAGDDIDLFDGEESHSSSNGTQRQKVDNTDVSCGPGAKSLLADDYLAQQCLAFLAVLEFLCECGSVQPIHGLLFKPQEIRRRLLLLLEQVDFSKALHLNMYLVLLKKLPAEDSLSPEEFDSLLRPLADLCSLYRQDQEVCAAVLLSLLPSIRSLGKTHHMPEEMRHVQGSLLQVVSGFCFLSQTGKCVATVRAALVKCLVALLEADPRCNWAVLSLREADTEEDRPVSSVLPSHLADVHHQVRMLVAVSVERLFVEMRPEHPEKKKMLPLKHQQAAFENVYLKAQKGMRILRSSSSEDRRDEAFNRKATLLKSLSVVLCCSPVCEKQCLFALFQSYKENNIEEQLLKKMLCSVSKMLGYRSVKTFVCSHLNYLVAEWLAQRQSDDRYTLGSFPYGLLDQDTVKDFYNSSYQVLIPHLVFLDDFEQVKSIGRYLERDWRHLLADCFPKIMVNILPYFALHGQDSQVAQQREKAHRVYDLLKDTSCLGKQQIDSLIHSNLADIIVELLMTLYEGGGAERDRGGLTCFIGELDPVPNPPYFSSKIIKATLEYLSKCHSATHKSLVAILSKTPISIQRILLAVCERAAETTNSYERHRILLMYHLFVSLLLREVKDGLGGAWAFVLRDIIYTLIHHINSRPLQCDEVSNRSLSLCCDLLSSVCQAALQFCDDALDCHLQVIVGTLTAQVTSRPSISQQVLNLLQFLTIENQQKLKGAISRLEPFPDIPEFRELRSVQQKLKYNRGNFTLRQEITHFLSVSSCDSLPLTRLEGLKELTRQLHHNKGQIRELLKEWHVDPTDSVLVKLVLSLLQLCKLAANHPGGADILEAAGSCLGELGPVDFSTIALLHGRDPLYEKAVSLFTSTELQCIYIVLNCMNDALTHQRIEVRRAAAQCAKNILATQSGVDFWDHYKDNRDPMLAYLNPFRTVKNKVAAVSAEENLEAKKKLQSQEFWIPQAGSHKSWLRALCTALLDSGGVGSEALLLSRPLCLVNVDCCQRLLPLIIHSILLDDSNGSWRQLLSSHIQDFFSFCSRSAQASSRSATPLNSDSESDTANQGLYDKTSLRTMLAVIDYLRHQQRPLEADSNSCGTVCDSNFWLELNYLEVAKAAQSCSAHFTSLLYSEIYVDKIKANMEESRRTKSRASRKLTFEENSQNFTISSLTEKSMEDTSISLQELLIEVYRSIGEPDSLYGCGGETMTSPLTRIRTYEHEAMWGKALTTYDLHSTLPEVTRQVGIVEGLQNFGLSNILATYMRGLESEGVEWGAELRELRFQAAWRNTQWDCELSERNEKSNPGFHESVFCALQALRDKEFSIFDETLKQARGAEVEELCRGNLEAVSSLYPALRNLQSIRELESVKQLFSRPFSDVALSEVCSRWRQHSQLLLDSDFAVVEPILAVRSVAQHTLFSRLGNPDSTEYVSSVLTDHLMELCRSARKAGNTQLAERAVYQMKQHSGGGTWMALPVSSWQLEEAQVFWAKGEQGLALGLLRQMTHSLEEKVDLNPALAPLYTECLRLCGNWLAETCLESPGVILENYLERAVEVIERESGAQDPRLQSQRTEAFLSLARFSDAQYQSIDKYMNSSEFENKQALLEKAKEEVDLIRERKVTSNRYTVKVQRELELDEKALSNLRSDRQRFLCKAVENYIQCLEQGEEHDTWVFRLASLWLENADIKVVNDMMKKGVKQIPSYKFLPLMYQLAARMGTKMATGISEDNGFHVVLNDLICKASLEHPHHTLFIIFALVNANKDENFCRTRLSKSSPQQPSPFDLERSDVARKIISVIRKKRAEMIRGIERLCDAYITLAYMDASRHKTEKRAIPIPADQPIMQIKDLEEVVIPTMEIKVDPSGCYDNLVTIRSFIPHYHLAGGVNLPKIIDCVGSDGKSRRQLVKGQDDLRQDAVMQQVFSMCSMLLQRNTDTRKRKLNIRRYKVVPFSQRSGVLEWCSGTMPIGEFLVDPQKGAHKRFRPQDWTSLACRRRMMEAQKLAFDEKLEVYSEVCKKFRPVFRYFCMERFLDPAVWMEKRLAYTRSVATSSIVGYIVGLGDRHIQNILIDEQTAELVHIDLGVAFEQGKILPTPETVPFRLSRDIVDGMGITGVEGVFRRCCEKTMEVMRSSQEALLTIVEVLLYDPLFDWTMNPLKAFYLQHDEQQELNATLSSTMGGDIIDNHRKSSDSQSFNKVAERVLLRLQEKLKGVEEGTVLSVGGQVNLLIQQALDPKNLSRLFPGWQAWV